MEEFEILKEVLYITSFQNISYAQVEFAFRRRVEYHITNTFLQVTEIRKIMGLNICSVSIET